MLSDITGNRHYLPVVSFSLTTQRKLEVALKEEFSISENALPLPKHVQLFATPAAALLC